MNQPLSCKASKKTCHKLTQELRIRENIPRGPSWERLKAFDLHRDKRGNSRFDRRNSPPRTSFGEQLSPSIESIPTDFVLFTILRDAERGVYLLRYVVLPVLCFCFVLGLHLKPPLVRRSDYSHGDTHATSDHGSLTIKLHL